MLFIKIILNGRRKDKSKLISPVSMQNTAVIPRR
jgi:hypothetical protein